MPTDDRLQLDKTWFDDGRLFASWRPPYGRLLQQTRCNLYSELRGSLHRACVHLKGHGGVKGGLRRIMRQQAVIATWLALMSFASCCGSKILEKNSELFGRGTVTDKDGKVWDIVLIPGAVNIWDEQKDDVKEAGSYIKDLRIDQRNDRQGTFGRECC